MVNAVVHYYKQHKRWPPYDIETLRALLIAYEKHDQTKFDDERQGQTKEQLLPRVVGPGEFEFAPAPEPLPATVNTAFFLLPRPWPSNIPQPDELDQAVLAGQHGESNLQLAQTVFMTLAQIHSTDMSVETWFAARKQYDRSKLLILRSEAEATGFRGMVTVLDADLAKSEQ